MKRDTTGKFVSNWNSETKQRVSVSLTSTAWRSLDQEAQRRGISRSEIIERFARTLEGAQSLDADKNGADAQINSLQEQILEKQQAITALPCQKQELEALLDNAPVSIARDVTDYKQVEQSLRESEERLRLALTAAQTVVWDLDLKTNRVVCSANALDVWGLQEGTGEGFFALIHPDDQQRVIQAAQGAIAGEQSYMQEYRVISPDGVMRWINSQGRVYLDETGQGVRMIGVSVDITERKQMEAERDRLLKREQTARLEAETERKRLHEILMQLPAMIGILKSPDLVYEFANPTYLQVVGRTPDMIGKSMQEVFPELEGQIYFDALK